MKLAEILDEGNIIADLRAKDKRGVLEELTETISKQEPSVDKTALVKVLVERERLGSTGIGDGVAIPHGKLNCVDPTPMRYPLITARPEDGQLTIVVRNK